MESPIYLDNHATTKIDPRVLEAMMPYLTGNYGNASSELHIFGWTSKEAVDFAREQVAKLINAKPEEIFFTSGATESNNLILSNKEKILTSSIEHSSVYNVCKNKILDNCGAAREIKVDQFGTLDLGHLKYLLTVCKPGLISVMLANNEVGTIQPIKDIRSITGVPIHSDMAQALGKIPIDVKDLGADFASFSAHKLYGPKGIGAIYIREDMQEEISPLMYGGSQEFGIRPGTVNVPSIVGFGKACDIAEKEMSSEVEKLKMLRATFFNILMDRLSIFDYHGSEDNLPGNLNICLPCSNMYGLFSEIGTKVAISFGAACSSGDYTNLSRTLKSMNIPDSIITRSIRVGFGRFNTKKEVALAANIIADAVEKVNGGK